MIGYWLATIPAPLFIGGCVATVTGSFAAFAWWCDRQGRRDHARIQADIDQALAIIRPVWRMLPCGCTWTSGPTPTVVICARHWTGTYSDCDYFHFDREMST